MNNNQNINPEAASRYSRHIAVKLAELVNPQSVLLVGFTEGELIGYFRHSGINAWGIAASAQAYDEVEDELKRYCVKSAEDFSEKCELAVLFDASDSAAELACKLCIRVLVLPDEAGDTSARLCGRLADMGFYRSFDFPASDIVGNAACFSKEHKLSEVLCGYEAALAQMSAESEYDSEDERSSDALRNQLRVKNLELAEANKRIKNCLRQNAELSKIIKQIKNSTCWRITAPIRFVLNPSAERREKMRKNRIYDPNAPFLKRAADSLKYEGISGCISKLMRRMHDKRAAARIAKMYVLSPEQRLEQEEYAFDRDVKFSIVVPLFNTPQDFLREMIESVTSQTYKNWELCLADGSDAEHSYVSEICRELAAQDSRIKYKPLEKNLGISGNTNICCEMATGDFICLFDHDDLLHSSALFEMMKAVCERNADFIYTDEVVFVGKINNIVTYHFKPDYAKDNLRANNYICHFTAFKRELFAETGGFRHEYDGSQDHDLILRLTALAKNIVHIPKVLYFWRSHPRSVAQDISSKPYAILAGQRAAASAIEADGESAQVTSTDICPTIYKFNYTLTERPLISILIVNNVSLIELDTCISSIINFSSYDNYEIIIAEDESCDNSASAMYSGEGSIIRVVRINKPMGYSALLNFAAKSANGKYLICLESDSKIISHNWIEQLLMYAQRSDVGLVGGKMYSDDGTVQNAGFVLGMENGSAGRMFYGVQRDSVGYMGRMHYSQNVSALSAECLMLGRGLLERFGGFNEKYYTNLCALDLSMKARKEGFLNVMTPFCELYHFTANESNKYINADLKLFASVYADEIKAGDPYFNPNFDLKQTDFRC